MSVSKVTYSAVIVPILATLLATQTLAQEGEQDDVSKALDSTATQWSYQFA
jgi:hypothetical protein